MDSIMRRLEEAQKKVILELPEDRMERQKVISQIRIIAFCSKVFPKSFILLHSSDINSLKIFLEEELGLQVKDIKFLPFESTSTKGLTFFEVFLW